MTYRKATIRAYRADDESLLFSLARESFGTRESWSDDEALRSLETDTVFVAELGGDRAGYVAIERRGDTVRIEQLLVSPRHEHEGIGNQLVDYVEGLAISEGATRLEIVVEPDNLRAREFYVRRSFVPGGEALLERPLPHA